MAVSPGSMLCPPGWVGIVALGSAVSATVPDDLAGAIRRAVNDLPTTAMTDPAVSRHMLPVDKALGLATLAYCDAARFQPADSSTVEMIPQTTPT